jgi:phospholipid/cholesterol/gamma-HCH transport system substrate-binding protein
MPQRTEVMTWKQLRVGVTVGVALVITVAGIFLVSGEMGVLGGHYTIKAYFPEAEGLRSGAEVDVAGVPAGNVNRVYISKSRDPNHAVAVVMSIGRSYQNDIRTDSVATVQTAGLLGQSFVDISRGHPSHPVVRNGGVLAATEGPDIKQVVNNANDVLSNLTFLSAKLNDISNQITNGKGTIGKFIYSPALYNQMDATVSKLNTMLDKISQGQGTIGQLITNDTLANKLNSTLDRANQLMDQIQNGHGTLAKFMNDPSVYNNLNRDLAQANSLMTGIRNGQGTLGKFYKDPQLYDRLNQVAGNANTIAKRMATGKGSLGLLSTDTRLYNNLSASMQSLRDFLTEFKKNPRKYLTVRVKIF